MIIQSMKIGDKIFLSCRDIAKFIGFTKGQWDNQSKSLKKDTFIKRYIITSKLKTRGGHQDSIFILKDVLQIWLSKINFNTLNTVQLNELTKLLEYSINNNLLKICNMLPMDEKRYSYECKLRDEIYDNGVFDNIKIIEKEKQYDFGRIDLYGIDIENNNICIELKKDIEFYDTKEQLLKYKNSNCFDKIIYCSYEISEEFKQWLIQNSIMPYTYDRKLILSKC